MSTFVLLPGAGSDSWYWHLVAPRLEDRGHSVVAVDLPYGDDTAGQYEYADLVVAAAGQVEAKREQDLRAGRDPDAPDDPRALFFHDVPAEVVDEAFRHEEVAMSDAPFETVWQAQRWPQVPTRVVAGRHDRLFPLTLVQRLARDRIGVEPDVVDTGHLAALARPDDLAALLLGYAERG